MLKRSKLGVEIVFVKCSSVLPSRSSLMDCRLALKVTPNHAKALVRAAQCSMKVTRCCFASNGYTCHEQTLVLICGILPQVDDKRSQFV